MATTATNDMPFYLVVWAFWLFVICLDLAALWSLRQSRVEDTARVLWVIWIVAAPVLGALSYFLVQPTRGEGGTEPRDSIWNEAGPERPRRSESIHR